MITTVTHNNQEFYYIREIDQVAPALEILEKASRYACDTETCIQKEWVGKGGSALDPHTGQVSLLIMKMEKVPPFVIDAITLPIKESIKFIELMERPGVYSIWHNAKFDWQMILSTYEKSLRNIHCTLVMSQLLGNATGSKFARARGHGYADLCRDFLNRHIEGKKSLRATTWGIEPEARTLDNSWWMEKLAYAATDTSYLLKLHDRIEHVLSRPLPMSVLNPLGATEDIGFEMRQVLELEWELTPTIARIEYAGLPCSITMLNAINEAVARNLDTISLRLCKAFELETVVSDPWTGVEEPAPKSMKVLRSPEALKDLIRKHVKISKIDTTEGAFLERMLEVIEQISRSFSADQEGDTDGSTASAVEVDFTSDEERDQFAELLELEEACLSHSSQLVKDILTFKRLVKQTGMDLRKFINPKTKRLTFKLLQCGTATGRCASSKFNCQQVPARLYLECWVEGREIFSPSSRDVYAW